MYFIDNSIISLYSKVYKLTDEQSLLFYSMYLRVGLLEKAALYAEPLPFHDLSFIIFHHYKSMWMFNCVLELVASTSQFIGKTT
jgi:hypothetical protein